MSRQPSGFEWSSPEGYQLARTILRQHLPYDPHDYQLEGICKCLDGMDLLAVVATGRGKTGFFSMFMLLQLALSQNPGLCTPPWPFARNGPCMIMVYPTVGLEEEQVSLAHSFMLM